MMLPLMSEPNAEGMTLPYLGMLTLIISKPINVLNALVSREQQICMSSVSVLLLSSTPAFASQRVPLSSA